MFCDVNAVETRLGRPAGSAWSNSEITLQIERATTEIKGGLLTGKVSQSNITSWDIGQGDSAPTLLQSICADLAAAYTLQAKANQSLSGDTMAAGLYKASQKWIDAIRRDGVVLFESDNEPITSADDRVYVTTSNRTPKFSVGDDDADIDGTLDEF
jgi:hypothetical protein